MYAFVAVATGWTWEYIGQCLTLPRLFAMHSVWRKYPPLVVSAASLLGIKPETTPPEATPETFKEAARRLALATTADPSKLQWITVPNPQRMM